MILAIDTSIGTSVAVSDDDGALVGSAESENKRGHAEVIGTLIERALAAAGARPSGVSLVAAGMGPGPFTGLRIGIAAARAFAIGRGVDVASVVSHDAAALAILRSEPGASDAPLAIVTDARRREIAVSLYDGLDASGLPRRVLGPELRPGDADLRTDPPIAAAAAARVVDIRVITSIPAADVARIAAIRARAGRQETGGEPLYLRSPDVSLPAPRKRVTA